ncbi:hypothetical protein ACO2WH_25205, partial [Escherichia coli]|uniref:hypothetical protein n=1 Tax=Escherichia coli TaxID=562 RepID=UPI003BFCB805
LLFYQAILKHYHAHLRVGGRFAFEINPLLKEELKQLFEEAGYAARLLEDYAHKWRFLIAEKRV